MTAWPLAYGTGALGLAPITTVPADGAHEPIIFLSPYHSDRATLTASSEASLSTPAALMQTTAPWRKWRSTEPSPVITLEFTRPIAADMLVFTASNLLPGDLIKIEAGNSPGVYDFDTGMQPSWRTGVPVDQIVRAYSNCVRFANSTQYRYWRITIYAANGQSYVEIGRLMLGASVQPSIGFAQGSVISFASPDAAQASDYLYFSGEDRGLPVRGANLIFESVDQSELEQELMPVRQLRGLAGDIFVDLFPYRVSGWEKTSMQARFIGTSDWTSTPRWNGAISVWQTIVQLGEIAL